MRSMKRQQGVTAIGWLIILGLIGFFVLLTLKMVPSYMEYYKIVSTLESLESETSVSSARDITKLIERRFDISYVNTISAKDVRVTSAGPNWRVRAKYDSKVHLFYNVYVVMAFDKQVQVRKS
jgi:membrane protein implicated in regulation of membrane protease activity